MRINVTVPEEHVDAPVLEAALEAVTRLNESMLNKGEIPTFDRGLNHGVKWKPEPPGTGEHFDHGREVLGRRWGDCDDLAPWHAASLRHTGSDPGAHAIAVRSGPGTWHAVVERSDGTIDDPSKRAGMGNRIHGIMPAVLPPMFRHQQVVGGTYIVRPQIALRPVRGWYQARADLPWHWREHMEQDDPAPLDYAMTTLHTSPVASTALTGAVTGACELAEAAGFGDPEHIDRLCAIADACEGAELQELIDIYGHDHARSAAQIVGSFWSGLAKAAHTAMPFASKAVQFVPGIGPVASSALDFAHEHFPDLDKHSAAMHLPALQPGGGGGSGRHVHIHF